tara:strand:- start:1230 stop:1433 length:204 start_codon:yes stop_codon:yes gene_type:complete
MNPKVGDMVYVPSETYLFGEGTKSVQKLSKPNSFLVIGEGHQYYQVLMSGNPWWVRKRDVYNTVGGD